MALSCAGLTKTYGRGRLAQTALEGVELQFARGETCVLLGPSGSGKTTLLSILGCLLAPSGGELTIDGQPVPFGAPERLAELRSRKIGFVFQQPQLLPFLTVRENLETVGRNSHLTPGEIRLRIAYLVERLGIVSLVDRRPAELSGGQRQRAAIARALLHRPPVLLADEPTAALDWENGRAAVELLIEQARGEQALLIMVTHDERLARLFDRTLRLNSGRMQ